MRALMLLVLLVLFGGAAYFWSKAADPLPVPDAGTGNAGWGSVAVGDAAHGSASNQKPVPATGNKREDVVATDGLVGRLLQNGEPLVGVTVIACQGSSSKADILARVVTDRDGGFRFAKAGERFWLTADGPRVPHHWRSRWIKKQDGIGDVTVIAPGSIAGVVRDEAGAPVLGAKLTRVIAAYRSVNIGPPVALTSISDEHGQFRFERVAKDLGKLRCQAVGYQLVPDHEVELDVGEDALTEIVMRPGMTLRGLVMDYVGHPLEGATVTTEDAQETLTDALGQFTIDDFRRYADINIRATGHLPHQIKWLYNTSELQRVKLERAATLRGAVIGSNN